MNKCGSIRIWDNTFRFRWHSTYYNIHISHTSKYKIKKDAQMADRKEIYCFFNVPAEQPRVGVSQLSNDYGTEDYKYLLGTVFFSNSFKFFLFICLCSCQFFSIRWFVGLRAHWRCRVEKKSCKILVSENVVWCAYIFSWLFFYRYTYQTSSALEVCEYLMWPFEVFAQRVCAFWKFVIQCE